MAVRQGTKHNLYGCMGVVVVCGLIGLFSMMFSHESKPIDPKVAQEQKWNSRDAKWTAAQMSQKFIEPQLKAPSTAKFQDFSDAAVTHIGEGVYTVSSYVDSQNSFGAMLRTRYQCILKDQGDDKWHLVDLQIGTP